MGFTDRILVSHYTREFTERCFLMYESLYKGYLAWLLLIYTLCNLMCIHQNLEVYSLHCICMRIYILSNLVKILDVFLNRKFGEYMCKMPPKKRSKRRGSQETERMSTRAKSPEVDELS